jgi:hypothetical protein
MKTTPLKPASVAAISKISICVLLALNLPVTAHAETEHFIVTNGGFVSWPILGPIADISVTGVAAFDTESGELSMDINQGSQDLVGGDIRLDCTVTITPDSISWKEIVFDEADVDFVQNTCHSDGWVSCSPPEVRLGLHRPWFLLGSAKGVRMSFALRCGSSGPSASAPPGSINAATLPLRSSTIT